MARISAGSSDGSSGAEKLGAEEGGRCRFVPSEFMSESRPLFVRRARRATGVRLRDEWMSPLRFFGVAAAGLLNDRCSALDSRLQTMKTRTRGTREALTRAQTEAEMTMA